MAGTHSEKKYSQHCSEKSLRWKAEQKIQTEQINFHQMREWMWAGINQPKSWCERTVQSFCCTPAVQGRVSSSPASLSTCSWCMKWDLWETLEGQINFSSVENMNKVTALHHKFKIYWVDLQLNEIPRTTSQYNFTCWLNKHAMSFDAQLTAAQPPQLNSVLWLILSYICLIAEGKRNSTKYLCSVTLNIKDLQ